MIYIKNDENNWIENLFKGYGKLQNENEYILTKENIEDARYTTALVYPDPKYLDFLNDLYQKLETENDNILCYKINNGDDKMKDIIFKMVSCKIFEESIFNKFEVIFWINDAKFTEKEIREILEMNMKESKSTFVWSSYLEYGNTDYNGIFCKTKSYDKDNILTSNDKEKIQCLIDLFILDLISILPNMI